jgi:hypothetical protein
MLFHEEKRVISGFRHAALQDNVITKRFATNGENHGY